ncbi:MAG: FliO/MopB family protein [Desulfobulbaceae bacterium]|nr:FliO/MopB family protein [Desulfobulbaceae bacterium]
MLAIHPSLKTFLVVLVSLFFFNPPETFGADIPGSDTESYFRVIWGLLVVLGIILVLYGIVRKRFSLLSTSPSQNIKILEIKPMMGKKALCLVDVKGQEYLLGISGDQINHIATLSPQPETSFAETLQATGATSQS